MERKDVERLVSIEKDVGTIKEMLSAHIEASSKLNGDQTKRLTAVEKRQWTWGGGLAVLLFIFPIILRYLDK